MKAALKEQNNAHSPESAPAKVPEQAERPSDFDDLVLEHVELLYAVALQLTRNPAEAEDLTQTTILKALRFHDKFKRGSYIKAWLLTILRNTFINEYRRRVRRPIFVQLSGTEAAPETSPDPEVGYHPGGRTYDEVLELLDDRVRFAIEGLPDEFRKPVIMADIEDKSYKEIAEAMDCPLGTVMSRLYRGRKLLRKELGEYAATRGLGKKRERS